MIVASPVYKPAMRRWLRAISWRHCGDLALWSIPYLAVLLASLYAMRGPAALGPLRLTASHNGERVAWVWPGSVAWDVGLRAGDTAHVSSRTGAHGASVPNGTTSLLATTSSGRVIRLDSTATTSVARGFTSTTILGLIFFLLTVLVYARAADRGGARAFALLFTSAALALTLVWPVWLGQPWALSLEFVTVALWGSAWANFFLVFPRRSSFIAPLRVALLTIPVGIVAAVYAAAVVVDVAWYPVAEALRGVVVLGGVGAGCLRLAWALRRSGTTAERHLLMILTLGSVVGVAPFLVGTLVPSMAGAAPLVKPQVSILPIALLPLSFAYAVGRHHLFGTTVRVRRALVRLLSALALGVCVVALAFAGVHMSYVGRAELAVGDVALGMLAVVATPLLWKALDRVVFADVYDEWRTLRDLTTALARLHDPHEMGAVLCRRLAHDMAVRDAAILIGTPGSMDVLATAGSLGDTLDVALQDEASRIAAADVTDVQVATGGLIALWVPLRVSDTLYGLLALGPKRNGEPFNRIDGRLLRAIAGTAAAALHGADLGVQLQRRAAQLDSLTQQVMTVHEEERRALARDLHDGPLSCLVHITHLLATEDDAKTAHDLLWSQSVAATAEVRALCDGLRASVLDDLGLADAVEALVEEPRPQGEATLLFHTDDVARDTRLCPTVEAALYNVAREALTNALRHADASVIAVRLCIVGDAPRQRVRVTVADNGRGFAVPAELLSLTCGGHYGLAGMAERMWGVSGSCTVRATLGACTAPWTLGACTAPWTLGTGTEVVAEAPLVPQGVTYE